MRMDRRREARRAVMEIYSLCRQDRREPPRSLRARGMDLSRSGVGLGCPVEVPVGDSIFVQADSGSPAGYGGVRHCTLQDTDYVVGIEFNEETKNTVRLPAEQEVDYYEFLQISPKAELVTIQRVYRFLASRYHPDNPDTGDMEKFLLLTEAFEVLSDPARRVAYDLTRQTHESPSSPAFESIDYMDGVEGEVNRRLVVLSLLYSKRRTCPDDPRVSLADLEKRMRFPREYLDFATWYLKSKKYISKEDNSDFALTALGVDYVESNASKIPVLHKMLNNSPWVAPTAATHTNGTPSADNSYRLGPGDTAPEERTTGEDGLDGSEQ